MAGKLEKDMQEIKYILTKLVKSDLMARKFMALDDELKIKNIIDEWDAEPVELIDEIMIKNKAEACGYTFAVDYNGLPFALFNNTGVRYFYTLESVADYLGIS